MKKFLSLSLAWLFISASCFAQATTNEYEQALSLFNQDKFAEAEIALKNSIQSNPDYLPARVLLGKTFMQQGKVFSAEKELIVSLEMGADSFIVVFPLAETKLLLDKPDEVISLLSEQEQLSSERDYFLLQGKAYTALGDFKMAENAYNTAASMHGNDAPLLTSRAALYKKQGLSEKAIATVEQALTLTNDHIPAMLLRGELLKQEEQYALAMQEFDRVLALEPENNGALFGQATLYLAQDKIEQALLLSTKLRERSPHDPYAKLLHASLLTLQGDAKQGKEVLKDLVNQLSSLPDEKRESKEAVLLAGIVDFMNQSYEQSRTKLLRYTREYGENAVARKNLATIALREGDIRDAELHINQALALSQDDVEIKLLASAIFKQTKSPEDYLAYTQRIYEQHATNQLIKDTYINALLSSGEYARAEALLSSDVAQASLPNKLIFGYLLIQQGKLEKATEVTQNLLKEAPNKVEILQLAGELSLRIGQQDDAIALFNQAIVLEDRFKPALMALAGISLNKGDLDKAEQYYRQILDVFPSDAEVLQLYADLAVSTNQYYLAIKLLESLPEPLRETGENTMALLSLYIATDQLNKAQRAAEAMETLAPFDQNYLITRSQLEAKVGQPDKAKQTLKVLYGLVYDDASRLEKLALLQLGLGDSAAASATITRLEAIQQKSAPFLRARLDFILQNYAQVDKAVSEAYSDNPSKAWQELNASNLIAQGQVEKALGVAEKLFAQYPTRDYLQLLAQLYASNEQTDALVTLLQDWVTLNNTDSWAVAQLSSLLQSTGDIKGARSVLEAYPGIEAQPLFLNNLAYLYQTENLEKAEQLARTAHQIMPDVAPINDTLGWILVLKGQPEQGLTLLREAVARDSGNPTYHYHVALALEKLNRMELAKVSAQKALELQEKHPLADKARQILEK